MLVRTICTSLHINHQLLAKQLLVTFTLSKCSAVNCLSHHLEWNGVSPELLCRSSLFWNRVYYRKRKGKARLSKPEKKSPIFFITHRGKYWQIGKDLCVIFRKRGNLCLVSVDKQLEQSLATPRSIVDAIEKTVFGHDLLSLAKKDFLLSLYY